MIKLNSCKLLIFSNKHITVKECSDIIIIENTDTQRHIDYFAAYDIASSTVPRKDIFNANLIIIDNKIENYVIKSRYTQNDKNSCLFIEKQDDNSYLIGLKGYGYD